MDLRQIAVPPWGRKRSVIKPQPHLIWRWLEPECECECEEREVCVCVVCVECGMSVLLLGPMRSTVGSSRRKDQGISRTWRM